MMGGLTRAGFTYEYLGESPNPGFQLRLGSAATLFETSHFVKSIPNPRKIAFNPIM